MIFFQFLKTEHSHHYIKTNKSVSKPFTQSVMQKKKKKLFHDVGYLQYKYVSFVGYDTTLSEMFA